MASINDKIKDTRNAARPNSAKVTVSRSSGTATLTCDNLSGWPTASAVDFVTYKIDSNSNPVAGTQCDWKGLVSGNTIGTLTLVDGTDSGNSIGDIVEMLPTANWGQDLASALTKEHDRQGGHGAIAPTSVTSSGAVSGTTGTFTGNVSDNSTTLQTYRSGVTFDFIESGCVLSGTGYGSTLAWNLTSGFVWIGGKRLSVSAASGTVTASKDTYFDLLDPGSGTVATLVNTGGNIVANNAASPALAASSVRLGIIVSGANIANSGSVNQGQETMVLPIASSIPYAVTDSLGNLICPRDPNRKILGYRQITSDFNSASAPVDITGLNLTFIAPANRRVKVSGYIGLGSASASNNAVIMYLIDVTNSSALLTQASGTTNASADATEVSPSRIYTPSATTTNVKAQLGHGANASTSHTNATSSNPVYLLVELV